MDVVFLRWVVITWVALSFISFASFRCYTEPDTVHPHAALIEGLASVALLIIMMSLGFQITFWWDKALLFAVEVWLTCVISAIKHAIYHNICMQLAMRMIKFVYYCTWVPKTAWTLVYVVTPMLGMDRFTQAHDIESWPFHMKSLFLCTGFIDFFYSYFWSCMAYAEERRNEAERQNRPIQDNEWTVFFGQIAAAGSLQAGEDIAKVMDLKCYMSPLSIIAGRLFYCYPDNEGFQELRQRTQMSLEKSVHLSVSMHFAYVLYIFYLLNFTKEDKETQEVKMSYNEVYIMSPLGYLVAEKFLDIVSGFAMSAWEIERAGEHQNHPNRARRVACTSQVIDFVMTWFGVLEGFGIIEFFLEATESSLAQYNIPFRIFRIVMIFQIIDMAIDSYLIASPEGSSSARALAFSQILVLSLRPFCPDFADWLSEWCSSGADATLMGALIDDEEEEA